MSGNRPNHRTAAGWLLFSLLLIGLIIPGVSAFSETYEEREILGDTYTESRGSLYGPSTQSSIDVYDIAVYSDVKSIFLNANMQYANNKEAVLRPNPYYDMHVTYKIGSTVIGDGHAYYNTLFNKDQEIIGVNLWLEIDNIDVSGYAGKKRITVVPDSGALFNGVQVSGSYSTNSAPTEAKPLLIGGTLSGSNSYMEGQYSILSEYYWKNFIDTEDRVFIQRVYGDKIYTSSISIYLDDMNIWVNDSSFKDFYLPGILNGRWIIKSPTLVEYSGVFGEEDEGKESLSAPVTIYVQNSQTGAAIANSRCIIDALVDGDYYPVVNRTEPSGIFSVTLQPTGGGSPNPDSYRLIASADGYINQVPEINFTVDEYITSIYCSLDPISGGPVDENKTFIDFFVRDMSANPITGATINFGGYTMITNSAGYAVLEVNKNATYTYTVSKSGYGSLTGNVVIGADPRHTINTVLAPAITPTKTTPIPTSTSISPTPTMTAPTGEPVSNWLDWFAAHFGMILGGGVEIGKIFMWLCFSVPVGVYVAKEAKAGAAGFMAGAGVVTLFFVLIGWVPIWLLVLLALIIGLLYSKAFNNSDNGGGR